MAAEPEHPLRHPPSAILACSLLAGPTAVGKSAIALRAGRKARRRDRFG